MIQNLHRAVKRSRAIHNPEADMKEKKAEGRSGEGSPAADFFTSRRSLEFRIGEGFVSAYEAAKLEPGDIVKTAAMAGRPGCLHFGGVFLGQAEPIVIGGGPSPSHFGVRLLRLEPSPRQSPYPERGEEAVELLPFAIVLAKAEYSLSELAGAGPESVIDMAKPYDTEEDAELVVAGMPLAAGKVVGLGESMGLRIGRVLAKGSGNIEARISGFVLKAKRENVNAKDYDFTRPDKYTKPAILSLREIHASFILLLGETNPFFAGFRLSFVDQMTYSEWLMDAARPSESFVVCGMDQRSVPEGRKGGPIRGIPKKLLVEHGESAYHFMQGAEEEVRKWISHKMGTELGSGADLSANILFAFRGFGAISSLERTTEMLECLRSGWRLASNARFSGAKAVSAPPEDFAFDGREMIILVRFANSEKPQECLDIVYPDHVVGKFVADLEMYGE
jgi:hypothetical protein